MAYSSTTELVRLNKELMKVYKNDQCGGPIRKQLRPIMSSLGALEQKFRQEEEETFATYLEEERERKRKRGAEVVVNLKRKRGDVNCKWVIKKKTRVVLSSEEDDIEEEEEEVNNFAFKVLEEIEESEDEDDEIFVTKIKKQTVIILK